MMMVIFRKLLEKIKVSFKSERVLYMKTFTYCWPYLAQFFLKWEMFQTNVVGNIKTHILCSIIFSRKPCRLWASVEKYGRTGQATDDMAQARCTLHTYGYKHTHTHTTHTHTHTPHTHSHHTLTHKYTHTHTTHTHTQTHTHKNTHIHSHTLTHTLTPHTNTHTHTQTHTHTHIHTLTLTMCNTYCCSNSTVVVRERINVTFIHALPVLLLLQNIQQAYLLLRSTVHQRITLTFKGTNSE